MKGNTPFIGVLETYVEGITNLFKPKVKKNKNEQPGNVVKYKAYSILSEMDYGLNPYAFGDAEIIDHTFEYNEELGYGIGTITFDKEITTIGNTNSSSGIIGWDHSSNVKEIILPNTVKTIYQVGSISGYVNIPDGVEYIEDNAFSSCRNIEGKEIIIPKSVTHIGQHVFKSYYIDTISVEKGNLYFDSRNNCNALISSQANGLIVGCVNTVIPDDIVWIDDEAFYYPRSYTFNGELRDLTIPKSVTSIGNNAFDSRWIRNLIFESYIPPSITSLVGTNGSINIYVPDEAVDTYKSTWNNLSSRIYGISELEI